MAATAAVTRTPPVHSGSNSGNLHARPSTGIPNFGQQDPGLHSTSQDLGPSFHPQHHVSARPILYVPAPPPPPLLQYQWPMPFSYNPFAGFHSMGYGMVMPPLPPPHYMEAPTYILPHHHIQPVDYRRLVHTQVQASSAPYQNPNQSRRIRQPHTISVRETVNSAVQTEPSQRVTGIGSPSTSSDSGHGTASNSPSSSRADSKKQSSAEVENYPLSCSNAKDMQDNRPCTNSAVKHGLNIPNLTGKKTAQSCIRATVESKKCHKDSAVQENVPHYKNGHCNMWSGSSPESMVPVCSSSQQEDELVKERRVSIPDILSWGSGTSQATTDKMLAQDDQLPSYHTEEEHENSVDQNPTETKNVPGLAICDDAVKTSSVKDSDNIMKILKLPFALQELLSESRREHEPVELIGSSRQSPPREEVLCPLSKSHQLPDNELEKNSETHPHESTAEITPCQMSFNSCQTKRKINESVWSVESLGPFIPTKEWLLQKSTFEPDIIIEMTEDAENGRPLTQNDNLIVKLSKERRQSYRLSLSDSVPISESLLIFSTPAEKRRPSERPEIEGETDISVMRGPKQGQSMTPLVKDPMTHPPGNTILSTPTEEDVEEIRSSEPEANQSPNQVSFTVNEQQEKSSCSPEQGETLLLNAESEKISSMDQLIIKKGGDTEDDGALGKKMNQLRKDQLCVPMMDQRMDEVSPSKGHLVDCGIQCTKLKECKCFSEEQKNSMGPSRRHPFKNSDMKKENGGKAEAFCLSGHVQKNQRRHNQWRNRGQDNQSSQKEAYNGYCGKPTKSRGGNGRNAHH